MSNYTIYHMGYILIANSSRLVKNLLGTADEYFNSMVSDAKKSTSTITLNYQLDEKHILYADYKFEVREDKSIRVLNRYWENGAHYRTQAGCIFRNKVKESNAVGYWRDDYNKDTKSFNTSKLLYEYIGRNDNDIEEDLGENQNFETLNKGEYNFITSEDKLQITEYLKEMLIMASLAEINVDEIKIPKINKDERLEVLNSLLKRV